MVAFIDCHVLSFIHDKLLDSSTEESANRKEVNGLGLWGEEKKNLILNISKTGDMIVNSKKRGSTPLNI